MDPTATYGIVEDVLASVAEAMAAILPEAYRHDRVHVVNGPPAIDGWVEAGLCVEHLVAWAEVGTATEAFPQPLGRAILCAPPSMALQIVVQSIRCEPTITDAGAFPDPEDLDLAARLCLADAYIAWNAVSAWALGNGTAANGTDHLDAMLVSSQAVPPQGGVAGWETRLVVEVEPCGPLVPTEGEDPITLPDGFLPPT